MRYSLKLSLALGLGLALSAGCAGPRMTAPAVDANELSDEGFQAYIAEIELVTVAEAYRAILILADGEDACEAFDQRRENLESRGIARAAWGLHPGNVIDAGSVAYMICQVCQIKGGINAHLFGSWGLGDRRYALRELVYRDVIEDSVDYKYVTGAEMVVMLRRADALMAEKGLYDSGGIHLNDEQDRDEQGELIVPPSPSEG